MIRKYNDPILHQVCEPIDVTNPESLQEAMCISNDLEDALRIAGNGVGLAAPQIGRAKRIIIIAPKGCDETVMFNPEIIHRGPRTEIKPEGCLSFPNVTARVKRHTYIRVRYWTNKGIEITDSFHGWHARIIQHEIDHLDGICKVGDVWRAKQARQPAGVFAA